MATTEQHIPAMQNPSKMPFTNKPWREMHYFFVKSSPFQRKTMYICNNNANPLSNTIIVHSV